MRLYSGQFNLIAAEIIKNLIKADLIEIEPDVVQEAELDVVGVLREYNRMDRELGRRARDEAGTEGSGQEQRIKRRMAREKGFKLGDDGIEYIVLQIIETFEHSAHVDEIYGTDRELRREISLVVKKYTQDRSEELDREVRGKIKNLQEGSSAFDVEYERVLAEIRRRKGLDAD